ncbi:MAG: hypothetical protein LBR72_06555 [Oscillospiraceae bacterium]|jgi:hypothetical protein|nr:hypothetical protein [Oscillospiraceae bacterium]
MSGLSVRKILDLENDGLNMDADGQFLYVRCKRAVCKYNLTDMTQAAWNEVFKKDGKARSLSVSGDLALLTDFCDLHVLSKYDLQEQFALRLGENASSDIWGAALDSHTVYTAVRNGKMAAVDLSSRSVEYYGIADSSFWDCRVVENRIYAGTVRDELIEIDKDSMRVIRKTELSGNKNIYSLFHDAGMLFAVSQDKTIKAVELGSLENVYTAKKAVGGMARILGIYSGNLIVADSNMVSVWDSQGLRRRETFGFPTGRFNKGIVLAGGRLIGSDYHGIYDADLG